MKLIVAGSRTITDYQFVSNVLKDYYDITEIVCGGAKGVDSLGKRVAEENNIPLKMFDDKSEALVFERRITRFNSTSLQNLINSYPADIYPPAD